ncbi:MAG: CDF family Co(II)/Ni(II) efflux transporter DmeF [Desulfobacteria bacterium]|nr:CDF family Co(II)/Ni(II) efflux transporter DmeF [Deltaproteobacteria bacterium]
MHTESIERWVHDHTFGQDRKKSAEHRTLIVIAVTLVTMVVEVAAGIAFGSMALLADGLHMGSHASALAISAFAYHYTRRHAKDARFNFGTGKVSSLAGFAGAVVLVLFALVMAWESIARFISPVDIGFNQAIFVAVLGLIVNGICLRILGGHGHSHGQSRREDDAGNQDVHAHEHPDHNFRSAYLHVLADALTSVLAIFALLAGKYLAQGWLDPLMGAVGAALVVRWSWGLLHSSARVLLDMQAPEELREGIREAIESGGDNRISDMHVWSVGPGLYAAEIAVVSSQPLETAGYYDLLPKDLGIVHMTVETHRCASPALKAL